MYKFKRGIPVDYDTQGYIYFISRRYASLTDSARKRIDNMCNVAGGEYGKALFAFVTTNAGYEECCRRHYISQAQLYRIVRRYYILFNEEIVCGLW